MKISIITVSYNSADTIEDTITSVLNQDYPEIEYIIIDGASTDNTMDIVNRYRKKISRVISEPDKGIYDAMNKGIRLATGDVIGILNADDFYIDNHVITKVAKGFEIPDVGAVFADLVYVKPENVNKTVRRYSSKAFTPSKFAYGWMPAHPTFFLKKKFYKQYGLYKTDYKIAADYELLIRMLYLNKVPYNYIPKILIKMRLGGVSTNSLQSNLILNQEILRACKENGIKTHLLKIYSKYPRKLLELLKR